MKRRRGRALWSENSLELCSGSGDAAGMPLERWRVTSTSTMPIAARDGCEDAARAWGCCWRRLARAAELSCNFGRGLPKGPAMGFHGVGIAEQECGLSLSGEGRGIERAQKGARSPPASGARARGEMDAGGLACAAIGTCLRTFCSLPRSRSRCGNKKQLSPPISHCNCSEKSGG